MTTFLLPFLGIMVFSRFVVPTVGNIWGLLALRLADDLILPFSYVSYANQLQVPYTGYTLVCCSDCFRKLRD